jgi:hypothetical protein
LWRDRGPENGLILDSFEMVKMLPNSNNYVPSLPTRKTIQPPSFRSIRRSAHHPARPQASRPP